LATPTQRAKLVAIRPLAPEVREYVLAPLADPIHFLPGQWLSLHLPIGERPPLVRAYSLAEPEAASGELVLALDRVPGGLGSSYLSALELGLELTIAGPYGNFVIPEPVPARLVLVARFTGIVPIRCILRSILPDPTAPPGEGSARRADTVPQVLLVYGANRPDDLIYHQEFVEWDRRLAEFRYFPSAFDGTGGEGIDQRPEAEILAEVLGEAGRERDFLPMVAGIREMVQPVRTFLVDVLGFERRAVRREAYD
jgi:phenol hydroxylase P5 protein